MAGAPAWADTFTAQQRAEIIEVVRVALKADPSILRDAIAALQDEDASQQQAAARTAIPALANVLTRAPGDPFEGNPHGDVTVVEFFDVRCPYCRRMMPVIGDLLARDHNLAWSTRTSPSSARAACWGRRPCWRRRGRRAT